MQNFVEGIENFVEGIVNAAQAAMGEQMSVQVEERTPPVMGLRDNRDVAAVRGLVMGLVNAANASQAPQVGTIVHGGGLDVDMAEVDAQIRWPDVSVMRRFGWTGLYLTPKVAE